MYVSGSGCGGESSTRPLGRDQALIKAVERGDGAKADRAIRSGAPLDGRDDTGRTALLVAVEMGHDSIALDLIERGADIDAQADNDDTPWLRAGADGRVAVLRSMIPRGPDLSLLNRFGGTALIPACERGHVQTVALLLTTRIDVDHVNRLGWTCLLEAVLLGDGGPRHQDIVRSVLTAGADPNRADREGVTALTHAEGRGFRQIARTLRTYGAR